MLTIVQRGGATREKPPEEVRGFSSRLPWAWDGLCFAIPFNDSTRDSARDLMSNAAPSSINLLSWTKDYRGNVTAGLVQGSSYIKFPDNPAHNRPSTAITVYVRLQRRASSGSSQGGILSKRYAATTPFMSWAILCDSTVTKPSAILSVNGTMNYWEHPTYIIPTTEYVSLVLRWRSGEDPVIVVVGDRGDIKTSWNLGSVLTGTISYAAGEPITVNATETDSANFGADYSQAMVWSRVLTDTELSALVADPFGWYSPRRETLGVSSPFPLLVGASEVRFGTSYGGLG